MYRISRAQLWVLIVTAVVFWCLVLNGYSSAEGIELAASLLVIPGLTLFYVLGWRSYQLRHDGACDGHGLLSKRAKTIGLKILLPVLVLVICAGLVYYFYFTPAGEGEHKNQQQISTQALNIILDNTPHETENILFSKVQFSLEGTLFRSMFGAEVRTEGHFLSASFLVSNTRNTDITFSPSKASLIVSSGTRYSSVGVKSCQRSEWGVFSWHDEAILKPAIPCTMKYMFEVPVEVEAGTISLEYVTVP